MVSVTSPPLPPLSLSRHRVGITHADNSPLQVWSPAAYRTSHLPGQGPGPAAGMSCSIFRTSPTATWLLPAPQDAKNDRGRSPGSHHSSAAVVRPARNPLTSAWQLYQDTATAAHHWLHHTAGVRPNISSCHAGMSHHSPDEAGTIISVRRPQMKAAINICLNCGVSDQKRSLNISLRGPQSKGSHQHMPAATKGDDPLSPNIWRNCGSTDLPWIIISREDWRPTFGDQTTTPGRLHQAPNCYR